MIFQDRAEAGEMLAEALTKWRGKNPLVVAIPRGAVPMGKIVAGRLEGELDVVLTRKLHAPGNPEFAIGAVDETGWIYRAEYAIETGATDRYVQAQAAADQRASARRGAIRPGRASCRASPRPGCADDLTIIEKTLPKQRRIWLTKR